MVSGNSKVSQYSATEVATANRLRLLVMLYDSAIRFVDIARERILEKDIPGKGTHIGKALSIVGEFKNTLNFQVGGDLPHQLERLYVFVEDRLLKANLQNNVAMLDEGRRVLDILRSAWIELEEKGVGADASIGDGPGKDGQEHYFRINV